MKRRLSGKGSATRACIDSKRCPVRHMHDHARSFTCRHALPAGIAHAAKAGRPRRLRLECAVALRRVAAPGQLLAAPRTRRAHGTGGRVRAGCSRAAQLVDSFEG